MDLCGILIPKFSKVKCNDGCLLPNDGHDKHLIKDRDGIYYIFEFDYSECYDPEGEDENWDEDATMVVYNEVTKKEAKKMLQPVTNPTC